MANLLLNEELDEVLKPFGFSSKTKAFKCLNNPDNTQFKKYYDFIKSTDLFSNERSEVLALMILNYNLNGSTINWGGLLGSPLISRGRNILSDYFPLNERKNALLNYNNSIKPETYNKWLNALNEYRDYISEGELTDYMNDRMSDYNKPEITIIDNNLVKVIIETKSPEYKELTIKQIESLLGYKIRIVG